MYTSSTSFSSLGATPGESLSPGEKETSFAAIAPELLQAFNFFINQTGFGGIAWRKAISDKKQESVKMAREDGISIVDNKHKLTGGPAYKELKNLIIIILSSSRKVKPQ